MTKNQLLKFIELVNTGTGTGYGGMRLMIAAEQAGFNIREIGKCTYGGGTYPVKTDYRAPPAELRGSKLATVVGEA